MFGKLFIVASILIVGVATACDAGASPSPAASSSEPDFVITVGHQYSGGRGSLVTLIDLSTGETLAQVTAGDRPWPLFRPSSGELLVSDFGGPDFKPRLRVFDIQDTSAPKWTMRLPNRAASTLWAPAWALSADERYLYYAARPPPDQYPNWIGIIDLDSGGLIDRARLPLGCGGYKTLTAVDGSKAQVFCSARRFVTVDPAGAVSDFAPFSWPEEAIASLARPTATPSPGLSRSPWRPAYPLIRGCTGAGSRLPCPLSESRRLLSYQPPEGHSLSGLLVYDEEQPADAHLYDLPGGITHLTPVNATTVALLNGNSATIYLFDLGTGSIRKELSAPPGTHWLVGPLLGGERQ